MKDNWMLFMIPLNTRPFSMRENFFQDVYEVVRLIPEGRVSTYGAIAKYLGSAKSARMVGWAMNASHHIDDVPAHRVVNRMGILSGAAHFDPQHPMHTLLEKENIRLEGDKIANFKTLFWDPNEELL